MIGTLASGLRSPAKKETAQGPNSWPARRKLHAGQSPKCICSDAVAIPPQHFEPTLCNDASSCSPGPRPKPATKSGLTGLATIHSEHPEPSAISACSANTVGFSPGSCSALGWIRTPSSRKAGRSCMAASGLGGVCSSCVSTVELGKALKLFGCNVLRCSWVKGC